MATTRELSEMADRSDAEAAILEGKARILRQQAIELRRVVAAEEGGLRTTHPEGTVGTKEMEAPEDASPGAKKAWAKIKNRWPLQVALFRRGLSLPEWARSQRKPSLSVETAKAWLKKRGHGGHRVPQEWAERIAREFGEVDAKGRLVSSEVPAVDASWPCGIRPPAVESV